MASPVGDGIRFLFLLAVVGGAGIDGRGTENDVEDELELEDAQGAELDDELELKGTRGEGLEDEPELEDAQGEGLEDDPELEDA